jgi:hypothetical protein
VTGADRPGQGSDGTHTMVSDVVSRYSRQLVRARHSGDEELVGALTARWLECAADLNRLRLGQTRDGDFENLAVVYAARVKELEGIESPAERRTGPRQSQRT